MPIDLPGWAAFAPAAIALAYGLPRVVIVIWSLRGTKPEDRAEILQALAGMYKSRPKKPKAKALPPPRAT